MLSHARPAQQENEMPTRPLVSAVVFLCLAINYLAICPRGLADQNVPQAKNGNNILSLIDSKTALSIAIRNPGELIRKSQKFSDRANLQRPLNIGTLADEMCAAIGVRQGFDKSQPVVISLCTPPVFPSLTLSISVSDMDLMAANFDVSAKQLQTGEILKLPKPLQTFLAVTFIRLKSNRIFMSTSKSLLDSPMLDDSFEKLIPSHDAEILATDDAVITLGQSAFAGPLRMFLDYIIYQGDPHKQGEVEELKNFFDDLRYMACGIRLDKGIGSTTIASLNKSTLKDILGDSFDSRRDATLIRIPMGKILASHALQADGKTTGGLLGSLLSNTRLAITNQLDRTPINLESYQLDGLLSEALDRVKGGHLVLYESSDRSRYGDFNLLGILTTDDPESFVADLTGLAPFLNAASMNETEAGVAFTQEQIEDLVTKLGDSHYERRRLAKLKLNLLGVHARPAIEKATKSRDLELRLAAEELLANNEFEAVTGRVELIEGSLFTSLKPSFTYTAKQDHVAKSDIGILTMGLGSDTQPIQNKMKTLFGPDWQKVRIATIGNEVVLMLGSETSILEKAIANQKLSESELNSHKACNSFRERAKSDTTFEFHMAISRLAYLLDLGISEEKSAGNKETDRVSSFGLTIKEKQVRVDTYTPPQDVKVSLEVGLPLILP